MTYCKAARCVSFKMATDETALNWKEFRTVKHYLEIAGFSIECGKPKTKPITYQLDYSANLKP